MSVQYFRAPPGGMPEDVLAGHLVLLDLRVDPHPVQTRRNGEMRDFEFLRHEIAVTPPGTRSGWRWFVSRRRKPGEHPGR